MTTLRNPWEAAFGRPDRRPMYTWGMEKIRKPSAWTRPLDIKASRHFVEPFDWLLDETIREVNIMAPVQSGKSLIADVSTCYWRANDPGPHLALFQDDDIAREYAEYRGMKILKSVHDIVAQLSSERSKTRTQEVIFLDGDRYVMWGPSLNNLQTFGYRRVTADELWKWKPGTLKEAKGRLSAYVKMGLDKLLCISQGGMENDDWDYQFQSGEIRLWHIKCESCGHMMYPHFSGYRQDGSRWGIRFDAQRLKDDPKKFDIPKAIETRRFECEKCGHAHMDSHRTRANWNITGEYRTEGSAVSAHKSHRWPVWIDSEWGQFVKEFLESKSKLADGQTEDMTAFIQKRLAEPASEERLHSRSMTFKRESYSIETRSIEDLVVMTVDRQSEGVYWVMVRVWTRNPVTSRRLVFKQCVAESDLAAVADQYKVSDITVSGDQGIWTRRVKAVYVDSRYDTRGDDGVYRMCADHGWCAIMGDRRRSWTHSRKQRKVDGSVVVHRQERPHSAWVLVDPGQGTAKAGRKSAPRTIFCSNIYRDRLQSIMERGEWIEPKDNVNADEETEYERQMTSERRVPKMDKFTKEKYMHWVCNNGNNHAADCAKMQMFAATTCGLL